MSIISEALKKANAERGHRMGGGSVPARQDSASRRWISSVAILAILILPFALPRFLNNHRTSGSDAPMLPMADVPQASSSMSGLAQMAVESRPLPVPAPSAEKMTLLSDRKLQGIVWTEDKGYYAILDNEVVREGARVGDYRVTRITPLGIALSDGTRNYFIEKSF